MFRLSYFAEYKQQSFNDRKVHLPVYLMTKNESLEVDMQICYGDSRKIYLQFEVKPNDKFDIGK
jgi:hypothetical protein